jgi:hypothetical protein
MGKTYRCWTRFNVLRYVAIQGNAKRKTDGFKTDELEILAGLGGNALTAGKFGLGRAPAEEQAIQFTVSEQLVKFVYRDVGKE